MIPTFVFEDGKEANAIWHYAVKNELMPAAGNILLHVNQYARDGKEELVDIYRFNRNEISLANFIIPNIYEGLFKQVYWLKQEDPVPFKPQSVCIFASGECLTYKIFEKEEVKPGQLMKWSIDPKYRVVELQHLTTKTPWQVKAAEAVVLDIVLDYFVRGGSEEGEISRRIEELVAFLTSQEMQVQMICIRRSRMSGLGREERWEWIEDKLQEKLSELYKLEIISVESILSEPGLNEQMLTKEKMVVSQRELSASKMRSDEGSEEKEISPKKELNTPEGRMKIYEKLVPQNLLMEIYNYYLTGLRWEFKNNGDDDDLLTSFWARKDFPDSIYELREIVRKKLDYQAEDPRMIVNGHVFGLGDGIHRDSYKVANMENPGKTAICYVNPFWRADWDGETKFYSHRDPSKADLLYACLPKPGRVIIFDGSIPHRGCAPNRFCNKLRITVAYQFPPPKN